jgi:UDP-N-acetylglucosamine transferase subunit ALG13
MIFVLVGTNYFSFNRLIKAVDLQVAPHHEVYMQLGTTNYKPINCKYFNFNSKDYITEQINKSNLVITHGGYGSMMGAILMGKKIIAVPRKLELNECLDNQKELVQYFESKKYVASCSDMSELKFMVDSCLNGKTTFSKFKVDNKNKIKDMIEQELRSKE